MFKKLFNMLTEIFNHIFENYIELDMYIEKEDE
jgi:hypothetical protein